MEEILKILKLEVSAILIEYFKYFEELSDNRFFFFKFAVKESQRRIKKRKRKISHLTHQVCHLQRSRVILKMKKRKVARKKLLKLQEVNRQSIPKPTICRPCSI